MNGSSSANLEYKHTINDITSDNIASIIDGLREAARYARTHPDEAKRLTDIALYKFLPRRWPEEWMDRGAMRLANNISVGVRVIHSNPDMLASYCRCAADELTMWLDNMRETETR